MSIFLRTGQPGHGKSYGAIRVIRDALEKGQWVATNIELNDGWAEIMAARGITTRFRRKRVAARAARYRERLYITHDLDEFARLRLPPCRSCRGCRSGLRCTKEARGRMVLDEAHNWLNSRTWNLDENGQTASKGAGVQKRMSIVRLFSQHRKLGWHVDLITQDDKNLDSQVRGLFEYHVHLKNLRRYRLLGILPVVPFNFFVAVTTWHDNANTRLGLETFLLNKKLAGCYDTMASSHGLDFDAADAILLGDHSPAVRPGRMEARQRLRRSGARRTEDLPAAGDARAKVMPSVAPAEAEEAPNVV